MPFSFGFQLIVTVLRNPYTVGTRHRIMQIRIAYVSVNGEKMGDETRINDRIKTTHF